MQVRLLGTGTSDGWPNPWCGCASCAAAAAAGVVRGQTSALVDGRLLLDMGQDAPRAAVRQGVSLADVEAVLVTHVHPDHHGVEAWMWRGWVPGRRPLHLVAPPAVLADAAPRLDDTVTTTAVAPGDRVVVAGYDVLALPAHHGGDRVGPPVLYDVTAPDGTRLLWGTDTGVLPDETVDLVAGRPFDLVLLELSSSPIPVHLDLRTWPLQVARLRAAGAVTDRTRLVAVHLGHDNPPPAELDRVLAGWGASAPPDGTVIDLGTAPAAPARTSRTLVLGGARSGKSAHAEQLLAAEPTVTYVATAPGRPGDLEWDARVQAHVTRRPAGWRTVETGDPLPHLDDPAVLVDDLGLWLTRVLDDARAWEGGGLDEVEQRCGELVDGWARSTGRAVLVAPEVGGGVVPETSSGRLFRDLLGDLTSRLAQRSDAVVQVVAGLPRTLR